MTGPKTCCFRYTRVVVAEPAYELIFAGKHYSLRFEAEDFNRGDGVVIVRADGVGKDIDFRFLRWLEVYLGEDLTSPEQLPDTRFIATRGNLHLDGDRIQKFFRRCQRYPSKFAPLWKQQLLDHAMTYYSMGLSAGFRFMPVTLGLFGLSLECIGNLHYGRRKEYFKLGDKRFLALLNARLARYKRIDRHREPVRRFDKIVRRDVDLLHLLRNAYYGHSTTHLTRDRRQLVQALRGWWRQGGMPTKHAELLFSPKNLDEGLVSEAPALFKVGVRTCRLFFSMLLGFSRPPAYATHDFRLLGNDPPGYEVSD